MQASVIRCGDIRRAEALSEALTAAIARREHVLLPADVGMAALDAVAACLAGLNSRVLRLAASERLSLAGLLAQLNGHAAGTPLAGPDLERGFELLTEPGPGCERIVLMLDRADALDAAALRYIQLAGRDAPLQLLFSGGAAFRAFLDWEEFGLLRRGFVAYAPVQAHASAQPALAPGPHSGPSPVPMGASIERPPLNERARPYRASGRTLAGIGVAASLAFLLWLMPPGMLAGYLADTQSLRSSVRTALLPQ